MKVGKSSPILQNFDHAAVPNAEENETNISNQSKSKKQLNHEAENLTMNDRPSNMLRGKDAGFVAEVKGSFKQISSKCFDFRSIDVPFSMKQFLVRFMDSIDAFECEDATNILV